MIARAPVALCLLVLGCVTTLPPTQADREAAITLDDFSEWVKDYNLKPIVHTFEKKTQLGMYALSYRFHGESEDVEFVLNSEVMITQKEAEAQSAYRSFVIGAKIGADELEEVAPTIAWPEQAAVFKSIVDGRQTGNIYVARRGTVALMVVVGGLHDSTSTFFEKTLEPALWALTRYDPLRASGGDVALSAP